MKAAKAVPRRPWLLLLPPVLMAVWVNVHGGFPIGLLLVGCYVLAALIETFWNRSPNGPRLTSWIACLTASVAATLANPYGWHVYEYVGLTSNAASGRHIDEWLPPSLDLLTGKVWVLSLLLLVVLFGMARRRYGSPMPGGSILITSAPKSDMTVAAAGPAIKLAQSMTLSPSKMRSVTSVSLFKPRDDRCRRRARYARRSRPRNVCR